MRFIPAGIVVAIAMSSAAGTYAAVSAEEAKQLGGAVLTEWGAERAGNKEGTIPAYTGKGVKAPPGWNPKVPGQRPDPYGEKPLFTITAQNAAQYADKLDGLVEMFQRYPSFRMDIYPTHRDYLFPKYVLDNTLKNATACKAVDDELKLQGCYGGYPFPIPKTGKQVMWNHLNEFESWAIGSKTNNVVNPTSGSPVQMSLSVAWQDVPYYDPTNTGPRATDSVYWRVLVKDVAPARMVGNQLVIVDSLDTINAGRRAYQYIPGQRRVKLAPDLAYDTPTPFGGGSMTIDDSKIFLGAMDRYNWKLIGKKEKYIWYNNQKITDYKVCPTEKIYATKYFINPDCVRWELHRVWVVEATLKPGFRHVYAKRRFFLDEDGFVAGIGENYDAAGKLYRISTAVMYPWYEEEGPGGTGSASFSIDLQTGVWSGQGPSNCPDCGYWPMKKPIEAVNFSPEAMAGAGIR